MKEFILSEFQTKYPDKKVFMMSSATGEGVPELVDYLIDTYAKEDEPIVNEDDIEEVVLFDLKNKVNPKAVKVEYL